MKKLLSITVAVIALILALSACSSAAKPLSDVFAAIKSEVGISEMVEFASVDDLDRFYGIDAADVTEFAGGINNSGVNQEEIVLIKASDKDAAARVETALTNRYNSKLNETKSYNPEQYAVLESCGVEVNGLYVSMILSANASAMKEIYHQAIGE